MSGPTLAWRLARRELRGGIRGFHVFLACIALGVAAVTAVATVSEAVTSALRADARLLLGGDLEVRLAQRVPLPAEEAFLRSRSAALSQVVEMRAMVRSEAGRGRPAMVELKAVDAAYPLLGKVELASHQDLHALLAERNGIWGAAAEPALVGKLGIAVGDRVRLGDAVFELRGTIEREPDRIASVAAFGPRLMIADAALPSTGLVQPASLLRHATRVLLAEGVDRKAWAAAARAAFPQAGWQIRDVAQAAPGVERFVERLATFLSFAGLATLLIGGLGVAGAVRTYLAGKAATIATLKCLGAPGGLLTATYLLQILILAGLGTALGLALGVVLPLLAWETLDRLLPVRIALGIYPKALLAPATLGILTALTFSLWPLGRARSEPASNLFRQRVAGLRRRPSPATIATTAAAALALAALAILTATDRVFGTIFVVGAASTLLALRASAAAVTILARRLPHLRSASLRLAIGGLRRPGAPTAAVSVGLGAGLTVMVAVALIDGGLRAQINERLPKTAPAFFFIDIQNDQVEAFDAAVAPFLAPGSERRVPTLRGRIVGIGGAPVEAAPVTEEAAWAVRGDRALTYAAAPPEDVELVAGAWWPADYAGPPLISLDAGLARGFGIGVGDSLTINVLGRDIEARVASLRRIEWRAVPFDFAIIFAPGTLEGAPHTHIAAVQVPTAAELALEAAIAERFPNVTAIRTREAIEAVSSLVAPIGARPRRPPSPQERWCSAVRSPPTADVATTRACYLKYWAPPEGKSPGSTWSSTDYSE